MHITNNIIRVETEEFATNLEIFVTVSELSRKKKL